MVTVYDGSTKLGTTYTTASGAWTYTTGTLSAGTHNFTTTDADTAGNVSAHSTASSVLIKAAALMSQNMSSLAGGTSASSTPVTSTANDNYPTLLAAAH